MRVQEISSKQFAKLGNDDAELVIILNSIWLEILNFP